MPRFSTDGAGAKHAVQVKLRARAEAAARAVRVRCRAVLCLPISGVSEGECAARSSERGSATVEFTFLALLLMVPVVYFIVTIGQIQGGSFAVVGAADQASKVYVTRDDPQQSRLAAEQAAMLTLSDYGHPAERASVDVTCAHEDCLASGGTVTVTVKLTVPLPMVPFGDSLKLDAAHLNASVTQVVGRFR
ncbi:MAG TPA: hypothetical protein VJQ60_14665 [Arthrobacter sp.]|nr:hypothetical protein [Arthrobacter sp.]